VFKKKAGNAAGKQYLGHSGTGGPGLWCLVRGFGWGFGVKGKLNERLACIPG